jgi:DNA-binding GntR family transcriptional regulator
VSAMTRKKAEPAYLRIAKMLRADIAAGNYGPGQKLPSETQLMLRHKVSRSVAKWAVAVLKADGLAEGRQGSGVFVAVSRRITRRPVDFGPAQQAELVEWVKADVAIARRLALMPGTLVIHTRSRCSPPAGPIQIMEAWRPADDLPDSVADRTQERIIVRPALPGEITDLGLPSRGTVIVITRDRLAREIPVETSDIIAPSDRMELIYEFPDGR